MFLQGNVFEDYTCILIIGSAAHGKSTTVDKLLIAVSSNDCLRSHTSLEHLSIWHTTDTTEDRIRMRLKNLVYFSSLCAPHKEINDCYDDSNMSLYKSTPGCEVITNEFSKLCVVDASDLNDNIMKEILSIQFTFHIKFHHVLYFLPSRGPLEKHNNGLMLDLQCMCRHYGLAVLESITLVGTVPPRFSKTEMPDDDKFDYVDMLHTREVFKETVSELFESTLSALAVPFPVLFADDRPPLIFLSLADTCDNVLDKVLSSCETKILDPPVFNSCTQCSAIVLISKGQKLGCIQDGSLVPYSETTCHPEFEVINKTSVAKAFSKFFGKHEDPDEKTCLYCKNTSLSSGCRKVGTELSRKDKAVFFVDHNINESENSVHILANSEASASFEEYTVLSSSTEPD